MKVLQESVPFAEGKTLRVLDLALPAFEGAVHAHPLIELTWISRGSGLRFVGGSVEPFEAGDLVLVAPNAAHAWLSWGPQPGGVEAMVMQVRPTASITSLPEWADGIGRLINEPVSAWSLGGGVAEEVRRLMPELSRSRGLAQLAVGLSILDLVSGTNDLALRRPVGLQSPRHEGTTAADARRIDRLLTWVGAHFHEDLCAAAAAQHLHVTPAAFSRAFKRLVGRSFTDYVNDLRIAEACLLLRRTDQPIIDVAFACGLPTLSNFNVQFRRRIGVSPREYRRAVDLKAEVN